MRRAAPMRHLLFVASVLTLAVTPAWAQTTIEAPDQGGTVGWWSSLGNTSFGQTITAPTDNVLESFSFWLGPVYPGTSINYSAYVYAWSLLEARATGTALFASTGHTLTNPGPGHQQTTFNTGGLSLATGSAYVLFLYAVSGNAQTTWAFSGSPESVYDAGGFVYNSGGTPETEFSDTWWVGPDQYAARDLAFTATFSSQVVPEPSTLLLLMTGLLGLGVAARRRQTNEAESD